MSSEASKMRALMESVNAIMMTESPVDGVYFHGSTHKIQNFVDEFVGQGNDQYGPGIYFSNRVHIAMGYGGKDGYIYKADIKLSKLLTENIKINKNQLMKLMKNSPDEYAVSNWAEEPAEAYRNALESYLDMSMLEACMYIWRDWYPNNPIEFVRELVKMGYDGSIYDIGRGTNFLVVYNPRAIVITEIMPYDKAAQLSSEIDPQI